MRKLAYAMMAGAIALTATAANAQAPVVVGNPTPSYASDCTPFCTPTIQTVYSASVFGNAPVLINSVGLWLNAAPGQSFTFTLSTSQNTVGNLSSTYASNTGADATVLFSGIAPATTDAQGYSIFSGGSFMYNPLLGDLLVQITSNTNGNGLSSYSTNFLLAQRAYDFGVGSATGYTNGPSYSFDTKFGFGVASAAVPEPASWALMIAGFGLAGYAMRRRKVAVAAVA